ncbi:melanoma inhibitory activity protein 2 isoform X2 [Coturnix japonica]|uniref:melanoma inhibitory activity protein 2 isoform X2 n=1 Tax=Coturnix japonica TaxID=93934 RepID=UPI000777DC2F|nr:melanoma inhibitory activity protein 2 isoform X2 [Coturnix japonica]
MSGILDHRIFLLALSFLTSLRSTKVLSEWKKCGDWECEMAMSRVQATTDYVGPDCRYLSFKTGEEITVYSKLSRKNEDLWIGSKGKDFGYFPKDAVKVEEVLIAEEVEVLTKETDFLCLDGDAYVFENEDSVLHYQNKESEYSSSDAESELQETELLKHLGDSIQNEEAIESVFGNGSKESQSQGSASKKLVSENENRNEDVEQPELQSSLPLEPVPTQSSWMVSDIAGWFATGSKNDEETLKAITEPSEENSYQGRKLAVAADNDLEEPNDQEEQEPTASGWLQGGLTDFLYFGKENVNVDLESENNVEIQDVSSVDAHSYNEHETAVTELLTEKEQNSESQESTSNWFSLGLSNVLSFGQAEKNTVATEDHASKEREDDASKNEEIQTLNQQESHSDKESSETFKEVLDEADVSYTQEVIDSNSNMPNAREITASVYTLSDTKNISSNTGSSSDKLIGDKEHPVDPCSSGQDVASVSQLLKNTEEKNPESERSYGQPGAGSKRRLLEEKPEDKYEMDARIDSERHSEEIEIPSVNSEEKMPSLGADFQHDGEKPSSDNTFQVQNYIPDNDGGWINQILLCLSAFEMGELVKSVFSATTTIVKEAVASLPEDMRPGPDLYGFPWELVIAVGVVGAFTIFLFLYRSYQSVRSRLYAGREKQLANKIAELVEEKCKILEKLSLSKKELEDLELSLKDDSLMKESDASLFEETQEKLKKSNLKLNQEIENLEKELEEEKSKQSENDKLVAEIQERLESLEKESKSIQSQVAEAKSTLKVYQINTERLKTSLQDAIDENRQLQESEKQLLQEAEGWGERFSELNEQTKMFESSKADTEEVLKDKESRVKSLTQYLLKMKDWSSAVRDDDDTEDNHWDTDLKDETENGEHLDDQQKRTIKKLIYAAKLNACLKTMETERDQMYSKLSDESKAKGELTERIENLQSEQVSLQCENERLESEVQKLQQKLKVMTELYQENEMKLHRKLTVEERERLQKEEKLSKVDEKITHAAEELNSYRERAKDLEEELERTIRSYENQITSHEKKAHDNWLTARAAERQLNDIRKENAHNRQKLTEAEFKLDLLEKDPYALDVPVRPFREHSPYGPSPMGRPSSETRAFLSPPTLLEGPLRLSPMLPGAGGGRGSRGPGSTVMYEASNERGDMSSDRLTDPHRPPSDTGSLSPPWDRERRIILPPSDGQTSSENSPLTEPSGNEMKDNSNLSNSLPDQLLVSESEAVGSGFAPPPFLPVRPPMMPMDPRGPFMRGPPFPPHPPAGIYGPRECFPVRDLGPPRPPLPMRNPFPMRSFPHYPPQRPDFLPPPLPPENRIEPPQSKTSATEQPEPQQET